MASGEVQQKDMHEYLDVLRKLDDRREGLDFEIQDLLEDLDTNASYEGLEPETTKPSDFPPDSKVGQLIEKILER